MNFCLIWPSVSPHPNSGAMFSLASPRRRGAPACASGRVSRMHIVSSARTLPLRSPTDVEKTT